MLPRLHQAQAQMKRNQRRFNVGCMGRRFGKSVFGVDFLLTGKRGALNKMPTGWFAPEHKYLDEAWRDLMHRCGPLIKHKDQQKKRIELLTGGSIECWSLRDPNAGRSRKYGRVVVDEAGMAPKLQEAWEQSILPTLTDYQGEAWFLSTPKGRTYFKTLYEKSNYEPDLWSSFHLPTVANPHIAPAEVERLRGTIPELVYRQEYLAEFVDLAGALVRREHLQYGRPTRLEKVSAGVDLAISTSDQAAWTAVVIMGLCNQGRTWVLDARRTRASFRDIIKFIQQVCKPWKPAIVNVEKVQFQAAVVQELQRTTSLPVRGIVPDKDKITRFLPIQTRYEAMEIWHNEGLPPAFEEEVLAFPESDFKDQVDALAFAFLGLHTTQQSPVVGGERAIA